jgi:hypothetical protein
MAALERDFAMTADARELAVEAARVLDEIEEMLGEKSIVARRERRQQRLALTRILRQLRVPEPVGDDDGPLALRKRYQKERGNHAPQP